ncbi:hypothetical protein D9M71_559910 [compost metagenome]
MLTSAANAPPNGTPQYITLTAVPRERMSAASADRAIRLGSAAPSPSPVRKRAASRLFRSHAWAVAMENSPNRITAPISTSLRPTRSASQPPPSAPGNRPRMLALNTAPIMLGLSAKAAAIPGAAMPTDCRSMPSRMATKKHNAIVT